MVFIFYFHPVIGRLEIQKLFSISIFAIAEKRIPDP